MKLPLFVFLSLCVFLTSISSYNFAYAFFMSTAANNNNSFTAAEVFPTQATTPSPTSEVSPTDNPTPSPTSEITPSPTDILTPTPTDVLSPTPTPSDQPTITPSPTLTLTPTQTPSPTATPTPTQTPTPTPAFAIGDVVINEINWGGSSASSADEWVELRNTTGNPINLTGWIITNLGDSSAPNITLSGSIAANGFFLISNANKNVSKINASPDQVTAAVSLVNGGEKLTLRDSTNNIIDRANDNVAWFKGTATAPFKSMERKNIPGDGAIATNWQDATTHTNMDGSLATDEFGTPRAANGL